MFLRLLLLLFIVNDCVCLSQKCLDSILQGAPYSNSDDIINGRKWVYEKKYSGSPLLTGDYWPKAEIAYDGNLYTGQFMNYDLYKNELIIYIAEKLHEKFILINTDKLSGFSFTDTVTGRKHNYELTAIPGVPGRAIYEHISSPGAVFYIKAIKKTEISQVGTTQGRWLNYYEYYLGMEGPFTRIRSKHQLFKLLPEHGSELKHYMRKNIIRINDQSPEGIYAAISYLNSLK
jgi:hypothetical protein